MTNKLLSGRKILVVEDEMLVLMSIEFMLADLGCESVTAAATAAQALALTQSHLFDFAILDVNLKGHETYAVADALVAQGVPFIFSTGYSSDGMRDDYRDRPVLRKPYQPDAMGRILGDLIAANPALASTVRQRDSLGG